MEPQFKKKKHFNRQKLQFNQYKKWGGNVCQSNLKIESWPTQRWWCELQKKSDLTNKRMWII